MLEAIRERANAFRKETFRFPRDGRIEITLGGNPQPLFYSEDLQRFSFQELQELCYILMHMNYNKGMNAIVRNEHLELWSRVDSLLHNVKGRGINSWIVMHNPLGTYIKLGFLRYLHSGLPDYVPERYNSPNCYYQNSVLRNQMGGEFPAVWTGFAYLEGLCRRICKKYVAEDGTVIKAFKVEGKQYRSERGRRRVRGKQKGIPRINNLHHLLELTRREVSVPTRIMLKKFFKLHSTKEIFEWRNACLHGEEDRSTTVIVVYSLISILLLDVVQKFPYDPWLEERDSYIDRGPYLSPQLVKSQTYSKVFESLNNRDFLEVHLLRIKEDFSHLEEAPEVVAMKQHFSQLTIHNHVYLRELRCFGLTDVYRNLTTEGAIIFLEFLLDYRKELEAASQVNKDDAQPGG